MALQFILSDVSVDKKTQVIHRLLEIKAQDPEAMIYYIVPEHLKFDMEAFLLETIQAYRGSQQASMIDIQVASFSRLAWFLGAKTNEEKQRISEVGMRMLIRQVLEEKADELTIYRGQMEHMGFIDKLMQLFNELYEGNIDAASLEESLQASQQAKPAQQDFSEQMRLDELTLLYDAFLLALERYDVENFELFEQLIDTVERSQFKQKHYIVIDHHYYFNAQQYRLLMSFVRQFEEVWLLLPLSHQEAQATSWQPLIDLPRSTYQQIHQLFAYEGLPIKPDWDIHQALHPYQPDVLAVGQLLRRLLNQTEAVAASGLQSSRHELWQVATMQDELRRVSNQIHHLVTEKGYRYQDILVLARDMDAYGMIVEPYFAMNEIPYFFDNVREMVDHPLVCWIEAVFHLKQYRWRYKDMMAVLRSELFQAPTLLTELEEHPQEIDHQIDIFENLILAYDYTGYRMTDLNFKWHLDKGEAAYITQQGETTSLSLEELADRYRRHLLLHLKEPLDSFQAKWTGREASLWFYQLLERNHIPEKLEALRDEAIAAGDIAKSREHEQAWNTLMQILDEFDTLCHDAPVSFQTFAELLLTGLQGATFHIIPPTLDQVTFTSVESPQVKPYKVVFLLGAHEFALPKHYQDQSLLSDANRETIAANLLPHQYLLSQSIQQNKQERLFLYQVFLQATEYIYISYPSRVGEQTVRVAPDIQRLLQVCGFPVYTFTSHRLHDGVKHSSDLGHYPSAISPVLADVRWSFQALEPVAGETVALLRLMLQTSRKMTTQGRPFGELLAGIFHFNELPERIQAETARALFGENIYASVSKIEQFYEDPYSHFLIYGLRLKERETYQIDYATTGDFFHEFLDRYIQALIHKEPAENKLLVDQQVFQQVSQALSESADFQRFQSQARRELLKERLEEQLFHMLNATHEQFGHTDIKPLYTEAVFGLGAKELKAKVLPLQSGGKLYLSGKIDRIDGVQVADESYIQVIDYKSSSKNFQPIDAYYGLDLQVLMYLSVALANYPQSQPLGAFYQGITQGFVRAKDTDLSVLQTHANQNLVQGKQYALQGFVTVDEANLQAIDSSLQEGKASDLYPVQLKKDGVYSKNSKYYDQEALQILLKYGEMLIQEAGDAIQAGHIAMRPFYENQYTRSLQQPYRVITGFDGTEHYQAYRHKTINSQEVIEQMAARLKEKGLDDDSTD